MDERYCSVISPLSFNGLICIMCFNYFLAGPNLEPSEEAYVSLLEFLEGAVSVGTRTGYAADWAAWCSFIGSEKG